MAFDRLVDTKVNTYFLVFSFFLLSPLSCCYISHVLPLCPCSSAHASPMVVVVPVAVRLTALIVVVQI